MNNYILVLVGLFLCTFSSLVNALLSGSIAMVIATVLSMIAGVTIVALIVSRQ